MIYSIIHYSFPYDGKEGKRNEEIVYTHTNINQVCHVLEELAYQHMERLCGLKNIQKAHPSSDLLASKKTKHYAISKLHKIEIYRLDKGYIYNSRTLTDEYKLIRCNYKTLFSKRKKEKISLKAINEELLEAIKQRQPH